MLEQVYWQDCDPILEQPAPEGLHPVGRSHLEQLMKNCSPWEGLMLEEFMQNCLLWEKSYTREW